VRSINSPVRSSQTIPDPVNFCSRMPFPPKKTGADALLPCEYESHYFLGDEECFFSTDQRLSFPQFLGNDCAGKSWSKGNMTLSCRRKVGHEKGASSECPFQSGKKNRRRYGCPWRWHHSSRPSCLSDCRPSHQVQDRLRPSA